MNGGTEPFGTALRRLRLAAGLTQEELAERAGLTAKGVSALERGERRRPYPHTVRALSAALELDDEGRAALQGAVPPPVSPAQVAPPGRGIALPRPATTIVGRDVDVAALVALVRRPDVRLVTVTGPGGVGKTRVALDVAHRIAADADRPVVFVPLAPVQDPALVLPAIAGALDLPPGVGGDVAEALAARLADRDLLLVLDNLEHLVAVAPQLAGVVDRCPGVRILSTSRAALRVRGEHDYALAPLQLPGAELSPEQVCRSAAVQLFVQRARQVAVDFAVTSGNAAVVAGLCRRLDGLPLALDVVAAQLRYADPATLLERIDRVLEAPGHHDLPARQRTLRATLQWSHDLCEPREQVVFRRLAVFVGGWTLEAAEAVVAGDDIVTEQVLEILGRLTEQSLVMVTRGPDGVRYRMLEPVRQYALERLAEAGESEDVQRRHAEWFYAFCDRPGPAPVNRAAIARYDRIDRDHANVVAALAWLLDHDPAAACRTTWSVWGVWMTRGHQLEGLQLALRAVDRAPDDFSRGRAALPVAVFASMIDDTAMFAHHTVLAAESARRAGDTWVDAHATAFLGAHPLAAGDVATAEGQVRAAMPLAEAAGDRGHLAMSHLYLANVRLRAGDVTGARELLQKMLGIAGEVDHLPAQAHALLQLGQLAAQEGDLVAAHELLVRGAEAAVEVREPVMIAAFAEALSVVAVLSGELEPAARLSGIAQRLRDMVGLRMYSFIEHDASRYAPAFRQAREDLGADRYDACVQAGAALPFVAAVQEILSPD